MSDRLGDELLAQLATGMEHINGYHVGTYDYWIDTANDVNRLYTDYYEDAAFGPACELIRHRTIEHIMRPLDTSRIAVEGAQGHFQYVRDNIPRILRRGLVNGLVKGAQRLGSIIEFEMENGAALAEQLERAPEPSPPRPDQIDNLLGLVMQGTATSEERGRRLEKVRQSVRSIYGIIDDANRDR